MNTHAKLRFQMPIGVYAILLTFSMLPTCPIAYAQTDSTAETASQSQPKQWRGLIDQFNQLVANADWPAAEQLANEAADKFGHEDSLVQHMLLRSINGARQSNGQTPILVESFYPGAKKERVPRLITYAITGNVPRDDIEHDRYATTLIECLTAVIDAKTESSPARIAYDKSKQYIVVHADRRQYKLITDILERILTRTTFTRREFSIQGITARTDIPL
jgi:hypothetical protein